MGQKFRLILREQTNCVGVVFRFVTRFIDVLIAPFVLEAGMLYSYIIARIGTLFVPLALDLLARRAAPQLRALTKMDTLRPFQAAAARVNLGYLMVCGGVAVMVLGAFPIFAGAIGGLHSTFDEILLWLVIGQSAPVLFGATGLLMQVVGRGAFHDVLRAMTALMFVAVIIVLNVSSGELVAQTIAAAQLTQAAVCAILLTQCGVWPGLTALFHKQIKLF